MDEDYPLDPHLVPQLSPQYVKHYNEHIRHQVPIHRRPPTASRPVPPPSPIHWDIAPISVSKCKDVSVERKESQGSALQIRYFVPFGDRPPPGWPVVIYFHGGGWMLGDLDSENPLCTRLCMEANAVVIMTEYRLAPAHPHPAAIEDSLETLLWVKSQKDCGLHLDLTKVVVGGQSAGANIAAVAVHKAIMKEWGPILFQVLLVPITDNTATTSTNDCWKKFEKAPGLSAEKMLFYRELYLQNADTLHWEVSPLFASPEQFQKLPPALIVVAEVDILQSDGRRYAAKMEDYGVEAEVVVMKRLPHAALTLGGVLGEVEGFVQRICGAVRKAFDTRTSQIDSLPASHNTQIDR